MKIPGKALLAATAAVAIIGAGGLALAAGPALHTMTVQLPDGATAKIQYAGNVAPKVVIGENPMNADFFTPIAPFDMLDAISARMDREMNSLFEQTPPINANQVFDADLRNMPKGMTEYSMVSTVTPNGMCMRQTEIMSTGNGKPKAFSRTSGNCGKASASTTSGQPVESAGNPGPGLQSVNYAPPPG